MRGKYYKGLLVHAYLKKQPPMTTHQMTLLYIPVPVMQIWEENEKATNHAAGGEEQKVAWLIMSVVL